MDRHSEYEYCIKMTSAISSAIWIIISDNGSGWENEMFDWTSDEQYNCPVELLKRIQEKENWTIKKVGDLQYAFEEDSNHLIFQIDDLFGFVIVLEDIKNYYNALIFIKKYTL